ncbi:MAG: ABC transporter ATP-binding protein [Ruthenibacterium sp.]
MKKLFSNFKGYYRQLILGPAFKLAEAVLELFIPVIMANIIDVGIKNGDVHYIITHGLFMLGLGAVGLCCALVCQYYAAVCAFGFGRSLRRSLFRHVYSLSQTEFGAVGTDSLITRLSNDVTQVQTGVNMGIRLALRSPFLIVGSVLMALSINGKAGLIFVVFAPVILFTLYLIMSRSIPYYSAIQKQQDTISRLMGENLSGVRVIRAFSRQDSEERQFNDAGDALADTTIRVGKISALLNPLTYVLVNLAIVCLLWMGGLYTNTGALTQGQVIALVNYMSQTLLALIVLANIVVIYTKAIASGKRVIEVLSLESSMAEPTVSKPEKEDAPRIEFENVGFCYKGSSEEAVSRISFSVGRGQTLGIIGGTGCGKTTLTRLLLRDFDVTTGSVRVDGVDVRNDTLHDLRAKIGVVPQTARLFHGTVRSNLMLGCPQATDAQLWQALRTAQGEHFVKKMPQQLDSPVEEGGKNLSGGQKQRLTIARALAAKPQILILDDAASALDYATDARLRKALKTDTGDMTVVMISQRASTIKNADCILVLDDGAVVGFGTHESLLATCEVYGAICASQGVLQQEKGAALPAAQTSAKGGAQK